MDVRLPSYSHGEVEARALVDANHTVERVATDSLISGCTLAPGTKKIVFTKGQMQPMHLLGLPTL